MRYLVGQVLSGGQIVWQDMSGMGGSSESPGLTINFPTSSSVSEYNAKKYLIENLRNNNANWLYRQGEFWLFNSNDFKKDFESFGTEDWLVGIVRPDFEVYRDRRMVFGKEENRTFCRFIITPEMVQDQMPKRIFLSHKGVNKPTVRLFKLALQSVGLNPWIDEDAMHAGVELERGLFDGFSDSCAAVFFITPEFKDENYLATEINYALAQKRTKGNRFSIITLALLGESGQRGAVPDILKQYVWKEPSTEISAFTEIIKALPVKIEEIGWK